MIAIDANILIYLIQPDASPPLDPATGMPLKHCQERILYLTNQLAKAGTRLILPTPALSEALAWTGAAASDWLGMLRRFSVFRIADFDQRAALECARLTSQHWSGRMKPLRSELGRHRVKFDLQIVAIARVAGARELLSDDSGVKTLAALCDMTCRGVADLPLPPEPAQGSFIDDLTPGDAPP